MHWNATTLVLINVLCFWYSYVYNFVFIFILKLLVWEFLPGFCATFSVICPCTQSNVFAQEYPVTSMTILMLSPTFAPMSPQAETCARISRLCKSCQAWPISFLGPLTKLRYAAVSIVMPVCLSVCLSVRPRATTRLSVDGFS